MGYEDKMLHLLRLLGVGGEGRNHKDNHLLLHHGNRLLGLLDWGGTSTPATRALTLLSLLDHWHKEVWHWSATPHARHQLVLISKCRLITHKNKKK